MCDEYGYFEVSRGYRTIPGNICVGGLQLAPYRYKCSMGGFLFRVLNFTTLLAVCVFSAIIYYGWPIIEGVILVLPIPDPKRSKARIISIFTKLGLCFKGLLSSKTEAPNGTKAGYKQDFELAPGGLEEEDDDEMDIGKKGFEAPLNYDSDEKNEELVTLDKAPKKQAPRLRKPATK